MNRRHLVFGLAAAAMSLGFSARPASAAGTVALITAPVLRGASGNGKAVTDALKASLEKNGYKVISGSRVQNALGNVNMRMPIPIKTLAALRTKLGVDYVVYPRVMSVGVPLAPADSLQATVIVNVTGKSAASFFHTLQVGQPFQKPANATPDTSVIPAAEAGELAGKLLDGFYSKAG